MNLRYMLVAAAMMVSSQAYAANSSQPAIDCSSIDVTKYDNRELAQITEACSLTKANTAGTVSAQVSPDDVRAWASLGKEFSVAVTETARGLGVTANEFLGTPAGILVVFYFMWDMIGGVLIGIPMQVLLIFLYFWLLTNSRKVERTYEHVSYLWGAIKIKRKVSERKEEIPAEAAGLYSLALFILTCINMTALVF